MKIRIIRNDITKIKAEAVVNTANPCPVVGAGTDSAVYRAAGWDKLLEAREQIGNIEAGEARITPGFELAEFIIHTVGPKYIDGTYGEEKILRNCYRNSLELVRKNHCRSVVFPLISTGVYGFPKEEGISIAISEINDYLLKVDSQLEVKIAVFDDESYAICRSVEDDIEAFIQSAESVDILKEEYGEEYQQILENAKKIKQSKNSKKIEAETTEFSEETKTFPEMIYYHLRFYEGKMSDIYRSVKIDRRLFSKILKKEYHPSKETVLKLCIGMRLTLPQTIDMLSRCDYAFNPSKQEDYIVIRGIEQNRTYSEIRDELLRKGFDYLR